jgi:hypothetical protein
MKLLSAALFLLFAVPAVAQAGTTLVARDIPVAVSSRQLTGVATPRFTMLGLHWQGAGSLAFRTRSTSGHWSGWQIADPEDDSRPDAGSGERSQSRWGLGSPVWTGPSDRLQVRARGVRRARAFYVWSPAEKVPPRTLSNASSPPIISRLAWGADESIRRADPLYADSLHFAVVHHTAGTNSYTRAESAAIVRGIERYHVLGNGWNDIGYNFLVDKYGQIFDRNVVGAHAQGFNTGSVGVSVLGNYSGGEISTAARDAVVRLLAWRLDLGHVDPLATLTWPSGGNGKFPTGVPVFLRAISGHRDTGTTDCPGNGLYAQLNDIATRIAQTGLPKLYSPAARGGLGGPVRFTGRVSSALPWTVTVTDSAGNRIASGGGTGTAIDWTWDATGAAAGTYAWTMEGGPAVLPARGTVGTKAAALAITAAAAAPAVVSPNADGFDDTGVVSYHLSAPATVTATVVDAAGATVATVGTGPKTAGDQRLSLAVDGLPDGLYTLLLRARGTTTEVTARVPLAVNRALGFVESSVSVFSPNGDGRLDTLNLGFALTTPAAVRIRIVRGSKWVANIFEGQFGSGGQTVSWDGKKPHGRLRDGDYEAEVIAKTVLGSVSQRTSFSVDTSPPALRLYSRRPLRVRVWEPVRLAIQLNGKWTSIDRKRPGLVPIPAPAGVRKLRVVARDAAGNASVPLMYRR